LSGGLILADELARREGYLADRHQPIRSVRSRELGEKNEAKEDQMYGSGNLGVGKFVVIGGLNDFWFQTSFCLYFTCYH
jgi:hypothetical protein